MEGDSTYFGTLNCVLFTTDTFILLTEYGNVTQKFYSSFQTVTDYLACCVIVPYLDLVFILATNLTVE